MTETIDVDHLRTWIGRTEENTDLVTPRLVASLRATLFGEPGEPRDGDAAHPSAHWCLTNPIASINDIETDGHPHRGGFLPPVNLPRRMWAGGRLEVHNVLRVGDSVTRTSIIRDVSVKHGRTGILCFVTVGHDYTTPRGLAVRERHDIVYRGMAREAPATAPPAASPSEPAPKAQHSRSYEAGPVLLFRYSALTFNGHRIHYDYPYVTEVEGYAGLVVHGPLQMSMILDYAMQLRGKPPKSVDYRGVRPLLAGPFTVNANGEGDTLELWTARPSGEPAMTATAVW